jgi:hypothetical protein
VPVSVVARLLIAVLTIVSLSCGPRPVKVAIVNGSTVDLRSVTIAGSGFSHTVNGIRKGETARVDVFPTGESGMTVGFTTAPGLQVQLREQGYFESGYEVTVSIDTNLEAKVEAKLD